MNIVVEMWSLLFALGIAQGVIMIIIMLAFNSANRAGNILLAVMLAVLTLLLLEEFLEASKLFRYFPKALFATFPLDASFGPLIYMYTCSITKPESVARAAWHVVPIAFLSLVFFLFHFATPRGAFVWVTPEPTAFFILIVNLKILYIAAYFLAALRVLRDTLSERAAAVPRNNRMHVNGALIILWIVFVLILIIYVNFNLNIFMPGYFPPSDLLSAVVIICCIYALAIIAIRFPFVFTEVRATESYLVKIADESKMRRYKSSSLSQDQKKECLHRLISCMEKEKPYRNQELKVEDLAQQVNVPAHHISQVINEVLEKNFYEFVNFYRVREVKEKMNDPAYAHKSLLGIALDAGFNSKATFNRVFKEFTGMTPSDYKAGDGSIPRPE